MSIHAGLLVLGIARYRIQDSQWSVREKAGRLVERPHPAGVIRAGSRRDPMVSLGDYTQHEAAVPAWEGHYDNRAVILSDHVLVDATPVCALAGAGRQSVARSRVAL
jgi:hypothetical protein